MQQALIRLSCRQVIRAGAEAGFEQQILHASYEEFLLKSQAYNLNGTLNTFSQMKANDGRANSLHYKTGFSIAGLMALLNGKIPGVKDALGQNLLFKTHRFELLESDTCNRSAHAVAIYYNTDTLSLLNQFGDQLLLAYGNRFEEAETDVFFREIADPFLLQLRPGISIVSYAPKAYFSRSIISHP